MGLSFVGLGLDSFRSLQVGYVSGRRPPVWAVSNVGFVVSLNPTTDDNITIDDPILDP